MKAILLIGLALFLVFIPSLQVPFIFYDDHIHIGGNLWLTSGQIHRFWGEPYFGGYIPVMFTVWSWIYTVSSGPLAFHIFNLVLHITNSILVFFLLRVLLPDSLARSKTGALFPPVAGALVFGLHALQVEPVMWVTAGRDVLCAFFGLSALLVLFYQPFKGVIRPSVTTVLFGLAILTKPTIVPLPLAALTLVIAFPHLRSRPRAWLLISWLTLSIAAVWWARHIQTDFASYRLMPLSLGERFTVAIDSLGFYLKQIAWPSVRTLDHGRTPQMVLLGEGWRTSTAGFIFLAVSLITFHRQLTLTIWAAVLFSVLMLTPILGLFPFSAQMFSTVADRYTYIPLVGAAVVIADFAQRAKWAVWIVPPLLLIHAVMSFQYSLVWRSNESLFAHVLEHTPRSYVALNALGLSKMAERKYGEAEPWLLSAWKQQPRLAVAPANLGLLLWEAGRVKDLLQTLEPFAADLENIRFNQHETAALSLLYLHLGRAQKTLENWDKSFLYYCNYAFLEANKPKPQREVQAFLKEMGARKGRAVSCN